MKTVNSAFGHLSAKMAALTLLALVGGCSGSGVDYLITGSTAATTSDAGTSSLFGNYLAARHASRQRDTAAAAIFYARARKLDPDNKNMLKSSFLLELTSGNMGRAVKLAREVYRFEPKNRAARLMLSLEAFRNRDFTRARSIMPHVARGAVAELASTLLTAWSYVGDGQTDKALAALKPLQNTPAYSSFWHFHAALIAEMGHRPKLAREHFTKANSTTSLNQRIVLAFGKFEERQGNPGRARELYNNYLKRVRHPLITNAIRNIGLKKPEPLISTAREGLAEAFYDIATQLSVGSVSDLSVLYIRMALYLRPEFPLAQLLLADVHERHKKPLKAIASYNKVPESSPLRLEADVQAALNLDEIGESARAQRLLKRIIARYPRELRPVEALANMLRGRKKYKEAIPYYTRAIRLVGKPETRHWAFFYSRGICYERTGQWPKAEKDLLKALELSPERPVVLNYLGYSWVERRRNLKKAMGMIRLAVNLRPNDGYIIDSLGWAHYRLGEWSEAVKKLERAVELQPEDPIINDHLGDAYWRAGRRLEARFQWSHALAFKPEPENLILIRKKLEAGLPPLEGRRKANRSPSKIR